MSRLALGVVQTLSPGWSTVSLPTVRFGPNKYGIFHFSYGVWSDAFCMVLLKLCKQIFTEPQYKKENTIFSVS